MCKAGPGPLGQTDPYSAPARACAPATKILARYRCCVACRAQRGPLGVNLPKAKRPRGETYFGETYFGRNVRQ